MVSFVVVVVGRLGMSGAVLVVRLVAAIGEVTAAEALGLFTSQGLGGEGMLINKRYIFFFLCGDKKKDKVE